MAQKIFEINNKPIHFYLYEFSPNEYCALYKIIKTNGGKVVKNATKSGINISAITALPLHFTGVWCIPSFIYYAIHFLEIPYLDKYILRLESPSKEAIEGVLARFCRRQNWNIRQSRKRRILSDSSESETSPAKKQKLSNSQTDGQAKRDIKTEDRKIIEAFRRKMIARKCGNSSFFVCDVENFIPVTRIMRLGLRMNEDESLNSAVVDDKMMKEHEIILDEKLKSPHQTTANSDASLSLFSDEEIDQIEKIDGIVNHIVKSPHQEIIATSTPVSHSSSVPQFLESDPDEIVENSYEEQPKSRPLRLQEDNKVPEIRSNSPPPIDNIFEIQADKSPIKLFSRDGKRIGFVLCGFEKEERALLRKTIHEHGGKMRRTPRDNTFHILNNNNVPTDETVGWLSAEFIKACIDAQEIVSQNKYVISSRQIKRWRRQFNVAEI